MASRPYSATDGNQWSDLFESVLFGSGRGVYVVPLGRPPADVIRRILVAWRDTREAARALGEAAPLIDKATRTDILLVDAMEDVNGEASAPELDLAKHLDQYGTNVEVSMLKSNGRPVSEVILDQAGRRAADVIVMGAYGHSRAHEWVLGGVTRDMLELSEFPVLMAH